MKSTIVPNQSAINLIEFTENLVGPAAVTARRHPIVAWAITVDETHEWCSEPIAPGATAGIWCLEYADGRLIFPWDYECASLAEALAHASAEYDQIREVRERNAARRTAAEEAGGGYDAH